MEKNEQVTCWKCLKVYDEYIWNVPEYQICEDCEYSIEKHKKNRPLTAQEACRMIYSLELEHDCSFSESFMDEVLNIIDRYKHCQEIENNKDL